MYFRSLCLTVLGEAVLGFAVLGCAQGPAGKNPASDTATRPTSAVSAERGERTMDLASATRTIVLDVPMT